MAFLPLIERELRVALRRQNPISKRLEIAAIAAGGCVLFILFSYWTNGVSLGGALEQILFLVGLFCVLQVPALTVGVLAEERRNQTLGLLFLTGMGSGQVFAGKFLSSALAAFTNLLAILPMLSLPLLLGGVSIHQFLAVMTALPVVMLLALALSMLASVLARQEDTAFIFSAALGALLGLLPLIIHWTQGLLTPGGVGSPGWFRFSPSYGPLLLWNGFSSGFGVAEQAAFWKNMGVILLWTLAALGLALFFWNRIWRESETETSCSGWYFRWRELLHGGRKEHYCLAQRWLDDNPFVWLAGHDLQPARVAWLAISCVVVVWLLCWAAWPGQWPNVPNFLFTAVLINSLYAFLLHYQAARLISHGRQTGAYELLLTTPLEPSDIVWGTLEALNYQFRALANFVFGINCLLAMGGLAVRPWNPKALIVYLAIWVVLLAWSWRNGHRYAQMLPVMFHALEWGSPGKALWGRSGVNIWYLMWLLYNLRLLGSLGRDLKDFPSGSFIELFAVAISGALFLVYCLIQRLIAYKNPYTRYMSWDPLKMEWRSRRACLGTGNWALEERIVRNFRLLAEEPLQCAIAPNSNYITRWRSHKSIHQVLKKS